MKFITNFFNWFKDKKLIENVNAPKEFRFRQETREMNLTAAEILSREKTETEFSYWLGFLVATNKINSSEVLLLRESAAIVAAILTVASLAERKSI